MQNKNLTHELQQNAFEQQQDFYTREDRIYYSHGLWYYSAKENIEIGPFKYRDEAEKDLNNFMRVLEKVQSMKDHHLSRRTDPSGFNHH